MMLSVLVYLTVTVVLLHCATAADTVQPFIYSLSNMYAEKANATLVCSVRSSSLPMFQWTTTKGRVSGKAVTRTMRDDDGTTYYENFYNFKVYSTDNDAKFTCKINLEGTAYTSEPFKLFVVVPPLIPSITGPASVFESNAKYTFQCDVRGGTMTAPTVVFRYEGEEIADGINTNITVRIGSNGLELQVSKVLRTKIPRDVKLYVLECESTTDFADTAATRKQYKQVVVYWTKPRTYPNSAEERVYDTAHKVLINCTMRADDLSSIRWESGYLKSEPVTTLKGSYFEEGSKMFWSAQIFAISSNDHEREYVCVATNIALVDIRSDPIRILVYNAPLILSVELTQGDPFEEREVTFTCFTVNASWDKPLVEWFDEHNTLLKGDRFSSFDTRTVPNNLLMYDFRGHINVTLPKEHMIFIRCRMYHQAGNLSTSDTKTLVTRIMWNTPKIVPSANIPYYIKKGDEMKITCSMSYTGSISIDWELEYNVTEPKIEKSTDMGITENCTENCATDSSGIQLYWQTLSYITKLDDNARQFRCRIKTEVAELRTETLIVFVVQPMASLVILGPSLVVKGTKQTWTCRIAEASITFPIVTWRLNDDDGVPTDAQVVRSVFTVDKPYMSYVHTVTSNLTMTLTRDNFTHNLRCIAIHKVASYYDEKFSVYAVTVTASNTNQAGANLNTLMESKNNSDVNGADPWMLFVISILCLLSLFKFETL
ncbi:uncharacterized protein LOC106061024 [Biomphalaria glabrata]|uniref:Uncharacterized protein LOC106061024 n=1 Tax=Biomphalaria glabrata TaxID=6526 RepID=A0A9W2YF26_BIOGL|nr:uncharacterized protein LOC106061024 [Biomphalaria glabrata]